MIKKRCRLAEEDITSDTDVKLASSGTIRPLCCSPGGVECVCVCGCQPLFLHPWTSSCLPYSPLSYTFLLLAVSPILTLHPALCITPPLHTSHTLTFPVLSCYLSAHHSVTENALLFVSFPWPPWCQSYRLTSRTYCLTFTSLLISSITICSYAHFQNSKDQEIVVWYRLVSPQQICYKLICSNAGCPSSIWCRV